MQWKLRTSAARSYVPTACRHLLTVANANTREVRTRTILSQTFIRPFSTNPQESFMSGSNSVYVEEMYRAWLKNKER